MWAALVMPASYRPAFFLVPRRLASLAATAFLAWADRSAAETPSQRALPPALAARAASQRRASRTVGGRGVSDFGASERRRDLAIGAESTM